MVINSSTLIKGMKKRFFFITFVMAVAHSVAFAQVPVIQNVAPLNTYSNDTLIVTGSGFSSTIANLDVWFGPVKGQIISANEFAIEVKVPAQAVLANIEVVNRTSRASAKSELKFMPSLKTEPFSEAKFAAPLEFEEPQELWDLCLCDLNGDGKPDVASTKFQRSAGLYLTSQDIMILQNQSTPGALSFTKIDRNNLPALNLGYATDNIVCGDLNADGKPELVTSRGSDPRNSIIIFNNTTGASISFATPSAVSGTILFLDNGHAATRMVLRDLNKDGKPEIIASASTTDFFYIFINQSSGGTLSFNPTPLKIDIDPVGTSLRIYEAEVQDFDGDGLPDVVVNRFQDNNLYLFKNQSTSSIAFSAPVEMVVPAEKDFNRLVSADINKDGKLDLILTVSSPVNHVSAVYLNQSTPGTIAFTPDASAIQFTAGQGAWGLDVSDIDGDKDPDFIVAAKDVLQLNIFLHNGSTTSPDFSRVNISTNAPAARNPRNIKVGDLDGDGKPEIAFIGQTDGLGRSAVQLLRNTHCHQPEILNAEPMTICNGQSIVLKTIQANNVTYEWRKDPAGANTVVGGNFPFLTITTGGTYRVTATNGGCTLSDDIVVAQDATTFPSDPVITGNTPLCVGSTLNLSSSTIAGGTYTWTKPSGATLVGQAQSFAVTLDDAGEYQLQVNVGVCKSNIVTKRIDVANLDNFSITSTPPNAIACQGTNVQLSVSNLANHTYQWEKDGVDINVSGTTSSYSASLDGSYTVRVTNTTLSCGTETNPLQVTILAPPTAAYTVDATACVGEELTFTSTSTTDSRATVVYTWAFGDATNASGTTTPKTYNTAQVFNTTLTVSYSGVSGCSNNTGHQVNVVNAVQPVISANPAELCPEEEATLSIAGTFSSILWSTSATTNPTTIIGPETYSVETVDENGCEGADEIIIPAKPVPTLTVSASETVIPAGATTELNAEGADTYLWSPAETLTDATLPNPIASPTQTTTYTVTGSMTDGCSATAELEIVVEGVLGFPIAFSPNSDGNADVWNIRAQDQPECTLSIFDGRGRRVYESKGENWDGTYEGKAVPAGTYYYVFGCPGTKPITGSVLVMK
jgi:gliding motility-associated-like protein